MSDLSFNVAGSDGAEHIYRSLKIPTRSGLRFAQKLIGAGAKPLARLISSVDAQEASAITATDADDTAGLLDAFDGLDIEALAGDLGEVISEMDVDVICDLFKYVTRDGIPLDTDIALDNVYSGNWVEFYKAAFHLVRIQGFLGFFGTSSKT
jgi:hypothetical protein